MYVPQVTSAEEQDEQKYGHRFFFLNNRKHAHATGLIMSYLHLGSSEEERKPRQPFYKIKK